MSQPPRSGSYHISASFFQESRGIVVTYIDGDLWILHITAIRHGGRPEVNGEERVVQSLNPEGRKTPTFQGPSPNGSVVVAAAAAAAFPHPQIFSFTLLHLLVVGAGQGGSGGGLAARRRRGPVAGGGRGVRVSYHDGPGAGTGTPKGGEISEVVGLSPGGPPGGSLVVPISGDRHGGGGVEICF
ncbi:hypothetical protein K491DRAFT_677588 [Lophiostoma macrostomum CBS 122681]|uniref:Uncharacterized protein n=1 Tax=Lophiostoma macrostomum CBS 122681 TaxID=1314788 RepID=A0A6A6TAF7_9PLEO|nr:hypothetical protein K491DRAFT_677588 [Lophiostoma macrostomum CBS 122681]